MMISGKSAEEARMAESTGESLNIIEDYSEFIKEYENATRGCYESMKAVMTNIMNMEGGNQAMAQSLQGRFQKDPLHDNLPKFSSSVGFRDIPPRHHSSNKRSPKKESPAQISNGFGRWTRATDWNKNGRTSASPNPSATEDFYRSGMTNCHSNLKVLSMNCEELERKFSYIHEQYETLQELISENEEHFVDLIDNSGRFIQDLQESGVSPRNLSEERDDDNKKMLDYLDSKEFTPYVPFKTFGSARSQRRGSEMRKEFERLHEIQKEVAKVEKNTSKKYESVIFKLEKNRKLEAQRHNITRKNYKVLAQASGNFQNALKDLQKAVRSNKSNVASYKKIFVERSRQLANELQKYKQLSSSDYESRNNFTDRSLS